MSLWRRLTRGFYALTHRSATDQDVADEVEHYVEQAAAEHVARGLTRDAALRAARRELGGVTSVREEIASYGWENVLGSVLGDVRYAARRLRAEPGFTLVAGVTLAVGIGATTAIFSAINPILFQSLPYPDAARIVMIWDHGADGQPLDPTFGTYTEFEQRAHTFGVRAALGATRRDILKLVVRQGMTVTSLGVAIGIAGAVVATRGLVTLLFGVSPLDLVTYVGVVALLTAVALAACSVPAWRAARVDPASTLRIE